MTRFAAEARRLAQSLRNSRIGRLALPGSRRPFGSPTPSEYERWIREFEPPIPEDARDLRHKPRISINVVGQHACEARTRASIEAQSYPAADASAEYAVEVAAGDELAPDALFHVARALNENPDADVIYSDEDRLDENGRRVEPFFKPDWSPDLFLSANYLGGLIACRSGCQPNASAKRVVHIPRVLYHRRSRVPSVRERRRYPIPESARVSILVPSGGKLPVLRRNLDTLFRLSEFRNFEVVVIDNSKSDAVAGYAAELRNSGHAVRHFDQRNEPFNYPRLNNLAAATCETDLLLFLNDDTCLVEPGSLTAMVELASRPEVGATGAKLLYPDGRIQHAGILMGIYGVCGHAFRYARGDVRHYFDFPDVIRNVSAVTGACLMVRAPVFAEAGGFDEAAFPIAYNDVDLCLRIGRLGYRILYTPHAVLTHHEAYSKSTKQLSPDSRETQELLRRWPDVIRHDPFYSPNLTRDAEAYSLRRK